MSFDKTAYDGETFSGLSLSGERLESVRFEECAFVDCRVVDSRFRDCAFIDCEFKGSVLSAINPAQSRFLRPEFFRCKVIGFDWSKAGKLEGLDFEECQVDFSNFGSLQLAKIRMVKCSAIEVRFTEADLTDGVFTDTDFQGSVFFKTQLIRADLRRAKNYSIDVRTNTVKNARFSLPEAMSLLYGLEIEIE